MKRSEIRTIEPEHFDAMCDLLAKQPRNVTPTRARAMLELMWATGLRAGEVRVLHADAIFDRGDGTAWVRVPCERGAKTGARTVPLLLIGADGNPTRAYRALMAWAALRSVLVERLGTVDDRLFVGNGGAIVGREAFAKYVRKLGTRAGVPYDVTPHMLRHTAVTRWVTTPGVTLADAQALAGHSDIAMTTRYVHLKPERLAECCRLVG